MALPILIAFAGLMGACGIMLAAAGAHMAPGAGLDGAAYMLLFHAVSVLGGAALVQQGVLWRPVAFAVLAAWILGSLLFSVINNALALTNTNPLWQNIAVGVILVLAVAFDQLRRSRQFTVERS